MASVTKAANAVTGQTQEVAQLLPPQLTSLYLTLRSSAAPSSAATFAVALFDGVVRFTPGIFFHPRHGAVTQRSRQASVAAIT